MAKLPRVSPGKFPRMQIYLPIAEMSINALLIVGMGGSVGFLSGIFGVGGGFLMTPLLIFMGVPAAVAVGTQANQLVAASVSGALAHWRRNNVDVRMGLVMLVGGSMGSALGVWIFALLQTLGQIDLAISLLYVFLLGFVGVSMLVESVSALVRRRKPGQASKRRGHSWLHRLPFRMRFHHSKLYISALVPGGIGFVGGVLVAIMGIGGGFLLVPAMIYIVGMPIALVAGTSLFQIIFTTALTTVFQAVTNQTVDVVLAFLLLAGGTVGVQFGTKIGGRLRGEVTRILLSLLVAGVAVQLGIDLVAPPDELYSIGVAGAPQ